MHRYVPMSLLRLFSPLVTPLVNAAPKSRLERAANVWDLREAAKLRTHRMCFDYLDGGADDEIALARSRSAYSDYHLHYHVLAGNSPETLDLRTKIFNRDVSLPFFMCPTAGHRMWHTEGELASASVAAEKNMLFSLSSLATTSIADVAKHHPASLPKCFQLYLFKDRGLNRDLLAAAREAGYDAVALTADLTWFGNRERDKRNGFSVPPDYSVKQIVEAIKRPAWTWDYLTNPTYTYANIANDLPAEAMSYYISRQFAPDFTWQEAEWIASEWGGQLALKGVVRADDAVKALDHGFSTIWISNHGGRQLETAPPPISVLQEIRDAVGDDVEVIMDGGVMRGTDIAKALALGANSVGIGKAYLYGLAAGGSRGVRRAVDMLDDELRRAMGLLGCRTTKELRERGRELVRHK